MSTSTGGGGGGGTTHSMSLMACVREASPSSQDVVATPRDADRDVIEPKRARRFDPFRGLRRMFRRRGGRSVGAVAPLGVGVNAQTTDVTAPSPEHDARSRSASELQRADESRRRSGGGGGGTGGGGGGGGGGWTSGGGLSVSHDSVFSASEPRSPSSGDDTRGASASSLSASRGQLVVQKMQVQERPRRSTRRRRGNSVYRAIAELLDAVRRRRGGGGGRGSTSDDDEDLGLPRSPPCVSPALHLEAKDRHVTQSRSTCSDGSLLSMGSSEMDEDSLGGHSGHSSKLSLHDKKLSWDQVDGTGGSDFELGVSSSRLSHAAARHKMAVRPKRTHPAPRRARTAQQLSVVDELAASSDIPDASPPAAASPTSPTPAPRRQLQAAQPTATAINHTVCSLKSASLPPGLTLGAELPAHAPAAVLPRSRSSAAARVFTPLGEEEAPSGADATESFFDRLLSRSGKKRKEQEERRSAQPRARQRVDPVTLPVENGKVEAARVPVERVEPAKIAVDRIEPARVSAERVEPTRMLTERMEVPTASRMQIGYGSPPKPTWPEHYRKSDTKIVEVLAKRMPVEPEDEVDDATAVSDSLYISNNSKLAHMLYSEPSSLAPNVGPDSLEMVASSPPQGERLFAKRGVRRPATSRVDAAGVSITQTNLALRDELDNDSLEADLADPLPDTEEVTEPVSLMAATPAVEGVTVSISVKTPHVSTATLGASPPPPQTSVWEPVRSTSPTKPQVSLLGMRVKKDSRDEAPAPEKLDNFVVRSLGELVSPSKLDPSRTQEVFFKSDTARSPGSPTKIEATKPSRELHSPTKMETAKPPRELHSPTKIEAAKPPRELHSPTKIEAAKPSREQHSPTKFEIVHREQGSPTRIDTFRVRALSSPTKSELANPPLELHSPSKPPAAKPTTLASPAARDPPKMQISPRPLSSPTKMEAARVQEPVFTMDSLRSPSELGSPTKLDPSRTQDLFAEKTDNIPRQQPSPTLESSVRTQEIVQRLEPVAKPRSLSLAAGTTAKAAESGVGRLPGRLMKQWSSQELDSIQIVEKEVATQNPKPTAVAEKEEGDVVLRRKSRDFSRGDEQPELLKVFARRSLKIKDSDLEADVNVVVRKDSDASKRDSDKENDGSPRGNRRKLSKEAVTEPEVARTPFKFQRSVSVVGPANDAVVVNRKDSGGDGLVHRRSVPDGSLLAQRWAAANREPVKEVVIATKPPEVVAVSRVTEVKKMVVKDVIIANKPPEVVAVNRLVDVAVKKMPVKEVIITSKPVEVPEVKKPVEDEVAFKKPDAKIEEVGADDAVPRFKRIQQRKEEWEQRAQRAAQQTS